MSFEYLYDDLQNYLVYNIVSGDDISELSLNMIGRLSGLIPCSAENISGTKVFKYPISNLIPLSNVLNSKNRSFTEVLNFIEQMIDIQYYMISGLIDIDMLVLNLDRIFVDMRNFKLKFICVPIKGYKKEIEFKNSVLQMLQNIEVAECDEMVKKNLIDYCQNKYFCADGLKNCVNKYKSEKSSLKYMDDNSDEIIIEQECAKIQIVENEKNMRDIDKRDIKDKRENQVLNVLRGREFDEMAINRKTGNININIIVLGLINILFVVIYFALLAILPRVTGDLNDAKLALLLIMIALDIYVYVKFFHEKIMEHLKNHESDEENFDYIEVKKAKIEKKNNNVAVKQEVKKSEINNYEMPIENLTKKGVEIDTESFMETEKLLDISGASFVIFEETGEKVYLNKNIMKFGRDSLENDYCINRRTVGRFHLQFDKKPDGDYITDLGSKNGTVLNGSRIRPNTEYLLFDKSKIIIADVVIIYCNLCQK